MNLKIGDVVAGEVSGIRTYGIFVHIDGSNLQGLIHISECQNGYVTDINQLYKIGQKIKVVILDIDEYNGKISLSTRALQPAIYDANNYHKKRYWTNYKNKIGYQTIADMKDIWIQDVLENIK
ncbi:CvfD/Ygs/GSP13 family RNA-binding post-transcriptional regulator [Bombilactobacillus bombi]|uniref:CvfD/Ygs/GSP13 family RNA-binding post-transcriptional regulator n=1 Tax=Bombilactobacillus bombi TaxID=1303590 RepID=UPI0015E5FB56|nr:CvfD/Ygs/GSP13 family RNA-binding post-transcriptional regulator [Bombilactobacillus bombi]MBA1435021.1 S1 RNA-binding domain-containing protein [Bombilactobacillus bombi]